MVLFLVALDESDEAERTYHLAARMIHVDKSSEIVVLNVVEHIGDSVFDPLHGNLDRLFNWEAERKAECVRRKFADLVRRSPVPVRLIQRQGVPHNEICTVAGELLPDVLFVGSRGLGPLQRMVKGSVSSFVLRHAPCPVILVPHSNQMKKE